MKRQELYIEKYDWHILLFLDYSCDYLDEVLDAMDKLKCGSKSYDIAYYIGYDNPKNFSRAFKAYFGMTPKEYRNGKVLEKG